VKWAVLVLVSLVAVTAIAFAVVRASEPPHAHPSIASQYARWKQAHPGYSCRRTNSGPYTVDFSCVNDRDDEQTSVAIVEFMKPGAPH
jgi:hypothetical protein